MYFRFGDLGTANILRRPLVFSGSGQRLINKKKKGIFVFESLRCWRRWSPAFVQ